jgi:hypothetical protein
MTDSNPKEPGGEPTTTEGNPVIIIVGLVVLLVGAILLGFLTQP